MYIFLIEKKKRNVDKYILQSFSLIEFARS